MQQKRPRAMHFLAPSLQGQMLSQHRSFDPTLEFPKVRICSKFNIFFNWGLYCTHYYNHCVVTVVASQGFPSCYPQVHCTKVCSYCIKCEQNSVAENVIVLKPFLSHLPLELLLRLKACSGFWKTFPASPPKKCQFKIGSFHFQERSSWVKSVQNLRKCRAREAFSRKSCPQIRPLNDKVRLDFISLKSSPQMEGPFYVAISQSWRERPSKCWPRSAENCINDQKRKPKKANTCSHEPRCHFFCRQKHQIVSSGPDKVATGDDSGHRKYLKFGILAKMRTHSSIVVILMIVRLMII